MKIHITYIIQIYLNVISIFHSIKKKKKKDRTKQNIHLPRTKELRSGRENRAKDRLPQIRVTLERISNGGRLDISNNDSVLSGALCSLSTPIILDFGKGTRPTTRIRISNIPRRVFNNGETRNNGPNSAILLLFFSLSFSLFFFSSPFFFFSTIQIAPIDGRGEREHGIDQFQRVSIQFAIVESGGSAAACYQTY